MGLNYSVLCAECKKNIGDKGLIFNSICDCGCNTFQFVYNHNKNKYYPFDINSEKKNIEEIKDKLKTLIKR